jgi:hypothetical protein
MDNLGAIVGPLLALALIGLVGTPTSRLGDRRGAVLVLERAVGRAALAWGGSSRRAPRCR